MTEAMIDTDADTCSGASLAAGEPLAGTASDAPLFAAIAWPKASWHHDKAAQSEGLPASVAGLEKVAKAAGRKLQLRLFDAGGSEPGVEVLCADFVSRRSLRTRAPDAEAAVREVERFVAGAEPATPIAEPIVLVCTDGRHDRCCGKLGRSLAMALRGAVDVAEASHLGGHRLAANCLVLPTGELYGRVTPADVPGLIQAIQSGDVYLPCYRGRTGLSELAQVAEAAALAQVPRARAASVTATANGAEVTLDGKTLHIACERRPFVGIGSCGDSEPETRERWVATGVDGA